MMASCTKSSSDVGLAEMVFFLHGNEDIIPEEVPQLRVGEEVEIEIPAKGSANLTRNSKHSTVRF